MNDVIFLLFLFHCFLLLSILFNLGFDLCAFKELDGFFCHKLIGELTESFCEHFCPKSTLLRSVMPVYPEPGKYLTWFDKVGETL